MSELLEKINKPNDIKNIDKKDYPKLAEEISKRAVAKGVNANILLEVNIIQITSIYSHYIQCTKE